MNNHDVEKLRAVAVGTITKEIVDLEARIRQAQLNADLEELSTLISDELLFAGPDGNLGSKGQDVEAYRSGVIRFVSHEPRELRMRQLTADVVVASLLTELSVSVNGNVSQGLYRYTRVWHRENDGNWRVAAGHVSQVSG